MMFCFSLNKTLDMCLVLDQVRQQGTGEAEEMLLPQV